MPRKRDEERRRDRPRTDLPPKREPYYEGYFGTGEEEGVERERQAGGGEGEPRAERERQPRSIDDDAAGGDREI